MAHIDKLRRLFTENIPERSRAIEPATEEEVTACEAALGHPLPEAVRRWFLEADFVAVDDANFETFGLSDALDAHERLLARAQRLDLDASRWEDNDGVSDGRVTCAFFDPGWLPFAVDGCGNYRAIDLAPGEHGHVGQILALEYQDGMGPFLLTDALDIYFAGVWWYYESLGFTERKPAGRKEPTDADHKLTSAIFDEDLDAAREALAEGAYGALQDTDGSTPLFLALSTGASDIALEIIAACPEAVNIGEFTSGYVPLTYASDVRVVEALLDAGADPRASWDGKRTALHNAAERGDVASIKLLVEAGAEVNEDMLIGAVWGKQEDAALTLLELGPSASSSTRSMARENGLTRVLEKLGEAE